MARRHRPCVFEQIAVRGDRSGGVEWVAVLAQIRKLIREPGRRGPLDPPNASDGTAFDTERRERFAPKV